MTFYENKLLPRLIDMTLGRPFEKTRARVAGGLSGTVLEVGFGSGRNIPHYPSIVTEVLAVEPATGARAIAAKRIASGTVPVTFVGLDGKDLPLPGSCVDHALITWTLCTIPDVERALREIHRVLRPGGQLHFVEHGRAANARTARWQDRLTPAWRKVAGGCHLNRPIPELVAGSGFALDQLETYTLPHTGPFGVMFEGTATKPAPAWRHRNGAGR